MSIRLWPKDYERKEQFSKAEKTLLKNAARNLKNGHFVVGIDPLGISTSMVKIGMYLSPEEGLLTFSIYQGKIDAGNVLAYRMYVEMIENKIYERLCDSKVLIIRDGEKKALKFPYKHIIMFPEERVGATSLSKEQSAQLLNYCTYAFFRPATSTGQEKTVAQLGIFSGVRKPYDEDFRRISELESRAIFERLAPEYTVVMTETENTKIPEKKDIATEC